MYVCVSKTAMVHMYNRLSPSQLWSPMGRNLTRCSANWLRHFSKKERDTQEISNNKHEKRLSFKINTCIFVCAYTVYI